VLELSWGAEPVPPSAAPSLDAAEWELLAGLRRGEEPAFEGLYREHRGRLYGLAYRLSGRQAEAEEITQDVFLKVWEHRAGFESPDHLRRWLRRVAVNLWINRVRRHRPAELDSEAALASLPAAGSPQGDAAAARLDVERALAALPARQRAVVVLFDIYGLRHEEIAESLGMTGGASKVTLHHARRRLKEILR